MPLHEVRQWVHRCNGSVAILLLCTGGLITFPDVRAAVIGGQGQVLSDIHFYTGLVFVTAPLLALFWKGSSLIENLKKRILGSKKLHWRRFHLSLALFSACMLAATGPIMWLDSLMEFPVSIMDVIFSIHLTFAWVVGLTLPLHLWMARKSIVRISTSWLGLNKKPANRVHKVPVQNGASNDQQLTVDVQFERSVA